MQVHTVHEMGRVKVLTALDDTADDFNCVYYYPEHAISGACQYQVLRSRTAQVRIETYLLS